MLQTHFFHINSVDKLPKLRDQLNVFLSRVGDDMIVSVNTTEVWPGGSSDAYSYTVLVVYKDGVATKHSDE